MFVGREKELALLQQDYIGKAVMVYGKRRVGKTTLIQKALESHNCPKVYFECLKGTLQDNIDGLVQELVRAQKNVERFFAEEKPAQENEQAR